MSLINILKEAAGTALKVVTENPVIAAGAAVGTAVVGYGGHRGLKYYRGRHERYAAKEAGKIIEKANLGDPVAVAIVAPALDAHQRQRVMADLATRLETMTREEAVAEGLLEEWRAVFKRRLQDKHYA